MRMVSMSKKKLHIIASKTTGTAEKNIIQQDNGILDLHKDAQYFGNGDKNYKIPHLKFENKIIFVLGYDNKEIARMLGIKEGTLRQRIARGKVLLQERLDEMGVADDE